MKTLTQRLNESISESTLNKKQSKLFTYLKKQYQAFLTDRKDWEDIVEDNELYIEMRCSKPKAGMKELLVDKEVTKYVSDIYFINTVSLPSGSAFDYYKLTLK